MTKLLKKSLLWIIIVVIIAAIVAVGFIIYRQYAQSSQKPRTKSANRFLLSKGYAASAIIKKDNLLYIQGTANNKSVYYLIDTGATKANLLSDGIALLNVTPSKTDEKSANMTGQITHVEKVELHDVVIGNIHLPTLSASVMQQPFKNDAPTIVIGSQFLAEHRAIIDIKNHLLYLHDGDVSTTTQKAIMKSFINQRYQPVPLTKLVSGPLLLPIQLNQEPPAYFLLDTGTGNTTISHAYQQHLALQPTAASQTQQATNGDIETAPIQISQITYNPLQLIWQTPVVSHDHTAYVANIDSLASMIGAVGVLGLSEMETIDMIIDLSTNMLFVKT